jgi:hypothetical protein
LQIFLSLVSNNFLSASVKHTWKVTKQESIDTTKKPSI